MKNQFLRKLQHRMCSNGLCAMIAAVAIAVIATRSQQQDNLGERMNGIGRQYAWSIGLMAMLAVGTGCTSAPVAQDPLAASQPVEPLVTPTAVDSRSLEVTTVSAETAPAASFPSATDASRAAGASTNAAILGEGCVQVDSEESCSLRNRLKRIGNGDIHGDHIVNWSPEYYTDWNGHMAYARQELAVTDRPTELQGSVERSVVWSGLEVDVVQTKSLGTVVDFDFQGWRYMLAVSDSIRNFAKNSDDLDRTLDFAAVFLEELRANPSPPVANK